MFLLLWFHLLACLNNKEAYLAGAVLDFHTQVDLFFKMSI